MDEGGRYWPIPYADLTLPAITLAEAKAAMAGLHKREGIRDRGREIVKQSKTATKRVRHDLQRTVEATRNLGKERRNGAVPVRAEVDFNRLPPDYGVEIWDLRVSTTESMSHLTRGARDQLALSNEDRIKAIYGAPFVPHPNAKRVPKSAKSVSYVR